MSHSHGLRSIYNEKHWEQVFFFLMHDRVDINYTCVLQYYYYLGLVVRRAET